MVDEILKTEPEQLYGIEYAPKIDDPLPGMMVVPETLLVPSLEVIIRGEWAYYALYKLSPDDLKNNTKGEFVERWIRP